MSAKKQLLAQFHLHNILFNNVTDSISDEEANKTVADPMNSVKWLSGHLVWAQTNLARIAGVPVEVEWINHFVPHFVKLPESAKGSKPTLEAIRNKWNEMSIVIGDGFEKLPEEVLNTKAEAQLPITAFDDSVAGVWAFINHHQAYTIGQIGILRRGLGKAAMKYD